MGEHDLDLTLAEVGGAAALAHNAHGEHKSQRVGVRLEKGNPLGTALLRRRPLRSRSSIIRQMSARSRSKHIAYANACGALMIIHAAPVTNPGTIDARTAPQ
jgi:hypothetical protein